MSISTAPTPSKVWHTRWFVDPDNYGIIDENEQRVADVGDNGVANLIAARVNSWPHVAAERDEAQADTARFLRERDEARAKVAAVEALAARWDQEYGELEYVRFIREGQRGAARLIRAALAGDTGSEHPEWIADEYERAKTRSAALPPNARPVVTQQLRGDQ